MFLLRRCRFQSVLGFRNYAIKNSMMGRGQRSLQPIERTSGTEKNLKQYPKPSGIIPAAIEDEIVPVYEAIVNSDENLQITTLPNGLRVVTVGNAQPIASVSVFALAGGRDETLATNGAAHLTERLLFKSTKNRTAEQVQDTLELLGAAVLSSSTRENIHVSADLAAEHIPTVVELIGDTLSNPLFLPDEVEMAKSIMAYEHEEQNKDYKLLLPEVYNKAAYGDGPLGLPLLPAADQLSRLTPEIVQNFVQKHLTADRLVLAATGVDHAKFVELAKKHFGQIRPALSPPYTYQKSKFIGGYVQTPYEVQTGQPDCCHIAFGVSGPGWQSPDLFATCVLQTLLGGGESFSSGGPGKGMYSRLYKEVMSQYQQVENANAFLSSYEDGAVFGFSGGIEASYINNLFDVLADHFMRVVTEPVRPDELQRAKNMLKSSLMMTLEQRSMLLEDIARQVLTFGKRENPVDTCRRIDAITAADVQQAARKMMASPVAVAVLGAVPQNVRIYGAETFQHVFGQILKLRK